MAQQETEQLTHILTSAALSRAVSTIAELGVADLVQAGRPQPVGHLARATKTHEASLYRILRFMAGYGVFQESEDRHFDHTPLSAATPRAPIARLRNCSTTYFPPGTACLTAFKLANPLSKRFSARRFSIMFGSTRSWALSSTRA